jgi:hypothetical protein
MFPDPEYSQLTDDGIGEKESEQMAEADRRITTPEAATKKVDRYLKEAENLIKGGYRHI